MFKNFLPPTASTHKEFLKGTVERITFHSEQNGFCVLRIKAKGHLELQTVVGTVGSIHVGEFVECEGYWHNDKQHGLQFRATQLKVIHPTTLEGIEKYLASGMIKGIGPGYAKRLIQAFQETVFEVIEKNPDRLCTVEGIGPKRKDVIIQGWAQQKKVRDIMIFLQSHGVGSARAVRIYKTYGDAAIEKMQENPYLLAQDISGIGFKTADQLAQRLGIAKDSILRIRAGVTYCLQEFTASGHCGCERETLSKKALATLEVSAALIETAIDDEIQSENIIQMTIEEKPYCYLTTLLKAERRIAEQLMRLKHGMMPWSEVDTEKAIAWVQTQTQITLSSSQQAAIHLALRSKVMIITGGPGVGKTTLVNSILKIIAHKGKILLAAPTGRAAKRLAESTRREAKTIHRLLEMDPRIRQFKRNEDFPLEADLIVIDEASMIDVPLMNQLLRAIPLHAALLLVGDVDQLPSVGPGMVLKDLIDAKVLPTVRLTEIFRQAASSQIIVNAHRINAGKMLLKSEKSEELTDFYFIAGKEPDQIKQTLIHLLTERIPARFHFSPLKDIQVLTPTKRGALGTVSLNIELQQYLNPQTQVIKKYGHCYGVGDKVLQVVNNYDKEIFNGDIGTIIKMDFEESVLWIDFDGREIEYEFSELDEINLAYATTIHKSQGSEYPVVIIPLAMEHYNLLERNLLYTAVTRGKKLVIVIGQEKALTLAIKRLQAQKRITALKMFLNELTTLIPIV